MTLSDDWLDAYNTSLKKLTHDYLGTSLPGIIVSGPVLPPKTSQADQNAQSEKIPPTEYRLDPWYVYTQIAGRDVKLELRADADMAGRELLGIVALMLGRVRGNTLVYLVEHDLLKHFEEVPLPQMDTVAQEEIARRAAELHDKATRSYQYQLYRHLQSKMADKYKPDVAATKRAVLAHAYGAKVMNEALHVPDPLPDRSPPKVDKPSESDGILDAIRAVMDGMGFKRRR